MIKRVLGYVVMLPSVAVGVPGLIFLMIAVIYRTLTRSTDLPEWSTLPFIFGLGLFVAMTLSVAAMGYFMAKSGRR
jgi:hypothetical protein